MPQLIWSPAALRDVQRLYRFLAEMNIEAAKRGAKKIRATVKIIRSNRALGDPLTIWNLNTENGLLILVTAAMLRCITMTVKKR